VTYEINAHRELIIDYEAQSDEKTFINLTNHSYFNLNIESGTILTHELWNNSDEYVEVDDALIPTGVIKKVEGPLDFRDASPMTTLLKHGAQGIDLTYLVKSNQPVARLYDPITGRQLKIITSEPGIQIYTGHFLDGKFIGKKQKKYERYSGICLEPQHFPDSPHHPHFPSTLLSPGQTYRSKTIYRFSSR
jgi:aldose 1-epimerase